MRLPNWYKVENSGVGFYQAWHLHATGLVKHGFSARTGGVSSEPYDSLNLGLGVDDERESVIENRRRFAAALEIDAARLVVPKQVHSSTVLRVDDSHAGAGALDYDSSIPDTDALITNVPGLPLGLHFADCVCIFLIDPANRAIGVVHAGWRGTAGKIVTASLDAMSREFGSEASAILAAIAPAINRHCFDVDEEVAREFFRVFPHDERVMKQSSSTKWRVDLKNANSILLQEAGVEQCNIAVSEQCTSCEHDEFYSFRRDGETGRMGGWMCLVTE